MSESLFNKVAGLFQNFTETKDFTHRSFLMNFARYLRRTFYKTPPGDYFCSTEKYFTNKINKNPLRKEKKWKQLVRRTTIHAKQKFNHHLHQVFISFYCSKISLFFFSLLPMIIVTRNNIVWKLVRGYCLCYCKTFLLVPGSTECTK